MRAHYISEKFTQDSDPISDMRIGIIQFCKSELNKLLNMNNITNASYYLFNNLKGYGNETRFIIDFLELITADQHITHQEAYEKCLSSYHDYYMSYGHGTYDIYIFNIHVQKNIINKIKEKFGIDLKIVPLLKENLYEKFAQDSDPIKDLGIGKQNFNSHEAAEKWIVKNLAGILGKNKIPNNIIYDESESFMFNWDYFNVLEKFTKDYITVKNKKADFNTDLCDGCHHLLLKMGYPKKRAKKKLNEKFTQDSDPIKDLGIGALSVLKNKYPDYNFNDQTNLNMLLIHLCSQKKYQDINLVLDFTNADVKYLNSIAFRYLSHADNVEAIKIMKKMMKMGVDVNDGIEIETSLSNAIKFSSKKMIKFLIDNGADIEHEETKHNLRYASFEIKEFVKRCIREKRKKSKTKNI